MLIGSSFNIQKALPSREIFGKTNLRAIPPKKNVTTQRFPRVRILTKVGSCKLFMVVHLIVAMYTKSKAPNTKNWVHWLGSLKCIKRSFINKDK